MNIEIVKKDLEFEDWIKSRCPVCHLGNMCEECDLCGTRIADLKDECETIEEINYIYTPRRYKVEIKKIILYGQKSNIL